MVLSGASTDGANGALAVQRRGGYLIVQTPDSAQAPILPEATLRLTRPNAVLAPDTLVDELLRLLTPMTSA
jgi:two-component system chemotaxis response regulator CheB